MIAVTRPFMKLYSTGKLVTIGNLLLKLTCIYITVRNIAAVKMLVRYGADVDLKCHGIPPLHLAVATAVQPGGQLFGYECFSFLLASNANAVCKVGMHAQGYIDAPDNIEIIVVPYNRFRMIADSL